MAPRRRQTAESAMATLLHLPPEICALICAVVEPKTLFALARVSHTFRDEAQRLIFQSVDLRDGGKALAAWCRAVSRNARLGGYVRRFTISSREVVAGSDDPARVARALKKCTGLQRLAVHAPAEFGGDATQTWVIDHPSFRLTHFSNSHFRFAFLRQFFNRQTDIRVLSLPMMPMGLQDGAFPCSEDQLPKLIALEVPSTDLLPTEPRPLQRIQLRLIRQYLSRDLTRLQLFAATLTSLSISEVAVISLEETFAAIAQAAPHLQHLALTENLVPFFEENDERFQRTEVQPAPRAALPRLRQLKTLVLYTYHTTTLVDGLTNRNYPLLEPERVAELFLEIAPGLKSVTIGAYAGSPRSGWRFVAAETTCTLTRGEGSAAHTVKIGNGYDFNAVSQFWD
ncbi:hypothetical protein MIND_00193300 [Mycena indigotica]|uniref:F-box domain-containing protein n=1 Tax=Mycena indigotica TaxID=2126181 RepID=A0A8H6T687_9AGAR|nr:uncharacterized protein MIND_00193300 [Mycena indigotica]KAF7311828.1 hypothetical protein MIND_00193300 [Mycena indigotica]